MADAEPAAQEQLFASFQYEIYGRGLAGEPRELPASLGRLEARAPEGELAVARAAAAHGLAAILSTAASHSMEDVAAASGSAPRWYQLYWPKERALAESFVGRAAQAGYEAIVVTLDTWMLGWRPRDLQ